MIIGDFQRYSSGVSITEYNPPMCELIDNNVIDKGRLEPIPIATRQHTSK